MSTTTATFGHHSVLISDAAALSAPTFFERVAAARMRQARAQVARAVARMPDEQLVELGFKLEQIRAMRTTGAVPVIG